MGTVESITSRLVHINLAIQTDSNAEVSSIMMRERPFIGELNLDIDPDNLSLLIAVGEVMDVAQPLTVSRISHVGSLAILWLDQTRWLVLPPPGSHLSVSQALLDTFGKNLELEADGDLVHVHLSEAAITTLQQCDDSTGDDSVKRLATEGVTIMQPCDQREYDILVRDHCAERLWQWLSQHHPDTNTKSQAAIG